MVSLLKTSASTSESRGIRSTGSMAAGSLRSSALTEVDEWVRAGGAEVHDELRTGGDR